jgi:hypothetical protein
VFFDHFESIPQYFVRANLLQFIMLAVAILIDTACDEISEDPFSP